MCVYQLKNIIYVWVCVCADALSRCSRWCDDSDTWLHVTVATEYIWSVCVSVGGWSPTSCRRQTKLSFFTTWVLRVWGVTGINVFYILKLSLMPKKHSVSELNLISDVSLTVFVLYVSYRVTPSRVHSDHMTWAGHFLVWNTHSCRRTRYTWQTGKQESTLILYIYYGHKKGHFLSWLWVICTFKTLFVYHKYKVPPRCPDSSSCLRPAVRTQTETQPLIGQIKLDLLLIGQL